MIALSQPRPELGTRADARTKEFTRCLALGADYIFSLDADQTVPDKFFYEAYRYITWPQLPPWDILLVDAPNKDNPDTSNIYYHPNGIDLAYFSISCCLIKSEFLRQLPMPWFRSDMAYQNERLGPDNRFIWDAVPKFSDDNRGEDIYFSRCVLNAGGQVIVLPHLKCHHQALSEASCATL